MSLGLSGFDIGIILRKVSMNESLNVTKKSYNPEQNNRFLLNRSVTYKCKEQRERHLKMVFHYLIFYPIYF